MGSSGSPYPPQKGVVIYAERCRGAPLVERDPSLCRSLHTMAQEGCSGLVYLPASDSAEQEYNTVWDLVQLFGVAPHFVDDTNKGKFQVKEDGEVQGLPSASASSSILQQRYGRRMRPTFFSESTAATTVLASIGATTVPASPTSTEQLAEQVCKCLEGSPCDLAFVHMRSTPEMEPIDALVSVLLPKNYYLVVVLREAEGETEEKDEENNIRSFSSHPLRPRQSVQARSDEKKEEELGRGDALLATYYQQGVTRRDHCSRFGRLECERHGGNATIHAQNFMAEVAYKLGMTPKYGA